MTHEHPCRSSLMGALPSNRLRRVAPWLALIAFVLFTQCYFTNVPDLRFLRNSLEAIGSYKTGQPLKPSNLHVLLVAYARTGSSFVGDLIQSLPDTFYYFEPIHFIGGPVLNSSFEEARDLLESLFVCNVSQIEDFLPWQMRHKKFMKLQRSTRYWKECSKNNTCYNGTYLDSFCRNHSTVIIKTIRLNLLEASRLFTSHPSLNLKIVYLVRDPRGTMNSRIKKPIRAWCRRDPMCSNAKQFCSNLAADVETTCSLLNNRPEDFMVLRYEDISSDPFGIAEQLAKFLGLSSVPDETYEFLKTHTYFAGNIKKKSKAEGLEVSYTTFRNSSVTAMSWRREMSFKNVMEMQRICSKGLSAFGYRFYQTNAALRSSANLDWDMRRTLETTCSTANG